MIGEEVQATPQVCRELRGMIARTTPNARRPRHIGPSRAELIVTGCLLVAMYAIAWAVNA